jgi:indole-3-acetate monooxygenase
MNEIPHPSSFIAPSLAEAIRQVSGEAEKLGSLHPAQLDIIYDQKWFNLFVPTSYEGLELTLAEGLYIEEALAWADGSTGWTVTLCSGANWFIGFLDPVLSGKLFNNKKVCLAGSGQPSGTAKITANGYQISGYWNYATGAHHATAFTANCSIEENGDALTNEDGTPLIRSFLFLKEEVTLYENWNVMGMIATGSDSFGVKNLHVGKDRCFEINSRNALLPHPIYQYPFLQFAEATLAVNSSGMGMRFLDLCEQLFQEKNYREYPSVASARKKLQDARQLFYDAVQYSWDECVSPAPPSDQSLTRVSQTSRALAGHARQLVDELYPYCGLAAADPSTEMNRVWRNLHTASQHSLLNFPGDYK